MDKPEHSIYEIALSLVIEQTITILQKIPGEKELAIIIEQRGKHEDRRLKKHFQKLYSAGTSGFSPVDLDEVSPTITFRDKKENINGLQLADLVAYPIARYLVNPKKDNPAFEVLKNKIYRPTSGWGGLKAYPKKQKVKNQS